MQFWYNKNAYGAPENGVRCYINIKPISNNRKGVYKISETTPGIGKCLCGSIKLSCEEMSLNVGACHCSTCQSWVDGPLLSADCGSNVKIEGKEKISIYNSSGWAERAFCSNCGSHLFYRLKHNNQHFVPVGLFGKEYNFNFDHQILIDEKPEYYCFSNQTKNMTGTEVFAQSQS